LRNGVESQQKGLLSTLNRRKILQFEDLGGLYPSSLLAQSVWNERDISLLFKSSDSFEVGEASTLRVFHVLKPARYICFKSASGKLG